MFGHKMYGEDVNISFIKSLIHDDDRLRVLNSLQEISDDKDQVYWKNQYRLKKADGSYATVMDSAFVVRDEHKVPYRIIGAMQDISERIQNEAVSSHRLRRPLPIRLSFL